MRYTPHIVLVLAVVFAVASVYLWIELTAQDMRVDSLESTLDEQMDNWFAERASTSRELELRQATIMELSERLDLTEEELEETEDDLRDERDRNDRMEEQVDVLSDTVADLDKLSKTDKELLQKYSKVYFLNEHYIPESLSEIDNEWKYYEDREIRVHSKMEPFLEEMLEDAKDDGIDLWVVSAYRSFDEQGTLKGAYTTTYGSGANAFSADQGYSEHQLGTTVDLTTSGVGGSIEGLFGTPAYEWLLNNAHNYGFTLSYPEGNSYYVFEPWHWRFVGEDMAQDLYDEREHFYDWEQRTINNYLLNIFD